jgi:hypothetical protein
MNQLKKENAFKLKDPSILGPIIGAGLGGLIGYRYDKNLPKKKKRRIHNIASSALAGGVIGSVITGFPRTRQYRGGFGFRTKPSPSKAYSEMPGLRKVKTKREATSIFRDRAIKAHPDKPGGSTEKMQRINVAWGDFKKSPAFEKLAFLFPFFWRN